MKGNYTYKPQNPDAISIRDVEEFLLFLLQDICEGSSNTLLKNALVNYEGLTNLSTFQETNSNTKLLISFGLNTDNPKNTNLTARYNDLGNDIKVSYRIGIIGREEDILAIDLLSAIEELVNALTKNWNGTTSQPTLYQATLTNNKILRSPLTLNVADDFPVLSLYQEDKEQPNYLTAFINILFILNK